MVLFFAALLNAQTRVSGKVTSKGRAVKDVSVSLKDSYDGATTDENGAYTFETAETGEHTLVFSGHNFSDVEVNIVLDGNPATANTDLKEVISEIDAVVLSAGAMMAGDKKRAAVLNTMDIYTTAGGNGQITTAFTTLPGIQPIGNAEGLSVRGGNGSESKFFMDGNLVNNFFTNTVPGYSGRDRLNPSLFKGYSFVSGGYSALYGQALSSAMTLESVDMPDESTANVGLSPIFASAGYQQVNEAKTNSYGISAGYSDFFLMKKILKLNTDFEKGPKSFSVNGNFRFKTKNGGMVKYYGSFDNNILTIRETALEPSYTDIRTALNGENTFHNLSWKEKYGSYTLTLGTSYTYNGNRINLDYLNGDSPVADNTVEVKGNFLNGKAVIERKLGSISAVRGGLEYQGSHEETSIGTLQNSYLYKECITAAFAETDLGITRTAFLKLGARAEHSSYLEQWNLAPRATFSYKISQNWVTFLSYGMFYQNPESRYLNPNFNGTYQQAQHFIYQLHRNADGRTLHFELFYKDYRDLIKTAAQNFHQIAVSSDGKGYAKGLELFWRDKKTVKDVDYWISYSYLDSKRDFLNYPFALQPDFASRHTLSIVAKKFVPAWKTGFNLMYSYTAGRPYYDIAESAGKSQIRQQGTVKDYNSLNFSLNYVPNAGKTDAKSFPVIVMSVNNILGNKNIYGYKFSAGGQRSIASRPPFDTFVFVGLFVNFGVDRTDDVINNNL